MIEWRVEFSNGEVKTVVTMPVGKDAARHIAGAVAPKGAKVVTIKKIGVRR